MTLINEIADVAELERPTALSAPTIFQIEINEDGEITRTMSGNTASEDFIEVDQATHDAARSAILLHGAWYRDGAVVPMPAPPPPPITISADVLFFERMTDDEYDDLDASVRAGESARVYRGWAAAAVFEERSAMWDLLVKHLDAIGMTPARKAELLAPPSASAARAEAEPA